jgi:alpha-beta hydrolase superfamily lysophospholipase
VPHRRRRPRLEGRRRATHEPDPPDAGHARWFTEAQGAQDDLFARADELDQPFLLLVAGADRLVDPSATEDLYRLLGSHDRTCEFLPKHFHEVLNEPDWDDSLRGIIAWMERHRAALEAGGPGAEDAI